MLFYIILTNFNHKVLARIRKLVIIQDKFKKSTFKKSLKIAEKKKKKLKNKIGIYIV